MAKDTKPIVSFDDSFDKLDIHPYPGDGVFEEAKSCGLVRIN